MRKLIRAHRHAQCQLHVQTARKRIAFGAKMRSVVLIKMHILLVSLTVNVESGLLILANAVQQQRESHNVHFIKLAHNVVTILLADGVMMDQERA